MRLVRHRSRVEEIPQAPLADMGFLLLIFFIASTTFALELGLPLLLPSSSQTRVLVRPGDAIRIQGRADDSVLVDGQPTPLDRIGAVVRGRNAARRAAGEEEYVVVIETDPRAEYRLMVGILDQVREADSRKVALKLLDGG